MGHSFHTPGYSETNLTAGGFALGYNARTASDTRSELGARFDRLLLLNPEGAVTIRALRVGARLGERTRRWLPCSRRFPARASPSMAPRRQRTRR